jgi:quercetin dioxygenase-like cupin family protein
MMAPGFRIEEMDPVYVDAYNAGEGHGAAFGLETEDLDMTLVAWPESYTVPPHVNSEVDVIMTVLSGTGEATVGAKLFPLRAGSILMIPKGAERSVRSMSDDFRYLNVHKRRRKLMPRL